MAESNLKSRNEWKIDKLLGKKTRIIKRELSTTVSKGKKKILQEKKASQVYEKIIKKEAFDAGKYSKGKGKL